MQTMRVYVANLGKYNEGKLIGAWFDLPCNIDEVKKKIGLNEQYEEYAIHDYELPFDIEEYTNLERLNDICEQIQDLDETIQANISSLMSVYDSIEELCEKADNIIFYPDCDDMGDLAYYLVNECGCLGDIPEYVLPYIDYDAYGRDLDLEGKYVITNDGIFDCT